jgi:TPR repeat protein
MSENPRSREETLTLLFHQTAERYWTARTRSHDLIDAKDKAFLESVGYPIDEFLDFTEDILGLSEDTLAWKKRDAEQGSMNSRSSLGYIYLNGIGREPDYAQALYWYRKAAELGAASSQCSLGYMYACGLGVEKDYAQSAFWYEKAAEGGIEYAQYWLADQYLHGEGVPLDKAKAAYWFAKSAAQGNAKAKEQLQKLGHGAEGA